MAWIPRQDKTQQDLERDQGQRPRVQAWHKRLSFMANHKPARSADWLKMRNTND